ncbi:MAG: STAS domain-containing protein [Clostridia bacterium]|nr:STAS domain-containing protein [Clostridia bacterium]NCC42854.1 STAS domain-containing protein [Clostridia bacterium]
MERFQMKQKKLIIRMPKELDHHSAKDIRATADQMIREENINQVEFDFRDTDFMDSSGIGVIMGRYQNIRLLGGGVEATHVNERIYKILKMAGLTKLIGVNREKAWKQGE